MIYENSKSENQWVNTITLHTKIKKLRLRSLLESDLSITAD